MTELFPNAITLFPKDVCPVTGNMQMKRLEFKRFGRPADTRWLGRWHASASPVWQNNAGRTSVTIAGSRQGSWWPWPLLLLCPHRYSRARLSAMPPRAPTARPLYCRRLRASEWLWRLGRLHVSCHSAGHNVCPISGPSLASWLTRPYWMGSERAAATSPRIPPSWLLPWLRWGVRWSV